MNPDEFVKGKRLMDPVTGREESYEELEKNTMSSKRMKMELSEIEHKESAGGNV